MAKPATMLQKKSPYKLAHLNTQMWKCMMFIATVSRLTAQVGWLGLRVSGRLALFYIHHMNLVDSTYEMTCII